MSSRARVGISTSTHFTSLSESIDSSAKPGIGPAGRFYVVYDSATNKFETGTREKRTSLNFICQKVIQYANTKLVGIDKANVNKTLQGTKVILERAEKKYSKSRWKRFLAYFGVGQLATIRTLKGKINERIDDHESFKALILQQYADRVAKPNTFMRGDNDATRLLGKITAPLLKKIQEDSISLIKAKLSAGSSLLSDIGHKPIRDIKISTGSSQALGEIMSEILDSTKSLLSDTPEGRLYAQTVIDLVSVLPEKYREIALSNFSGLRFIAVPLSTASVFLPKSTEEEATLRTVLMLTSKVLTKAFNNKTFDRSSQPHLAFANGILSSGLQAKVDAFQGSFLEKKNKFV